MKFENIHEFIELYCHNINKTDDSGDTARKQLIIRILTRSKFGSGSYSATTTKMLSDFVLENIIDCKYLDSMATEAVKELTFIQNIGPNTGASYPVIIESNDNYTLKDLIAQLSKYTDGIQEYKDALAYSNV